jgi:hypothetical protein
MPRKRSRSPHQASPDEQPLLAERIQRNPILRAFGSFMVGQAIWRRNTLGEGSVAPTPVVLAPDPVEPAAADGDDSYPARSDHDPLR